MAGFTNYAYRQVVREFGGAGLQATEMILRQGFLGREKFEGELPERLWGVADEGGRWRCRFGITIRADWPPWLRS